MLHMTASPQPYDLYILMLKSAAALDVTPPPEPFGFARANNVWTADESAEYMKR